MSGLTLKPTLEAGIELWKRWFDWSGNPWVRGEKKTDKHCFFCQSPYPVHDEAMCIYVSAKELVKLDEKGELE